VVRASARSGRLLPCRFGRYTLFDRIGQGGMADIYLARVRTELGAARLAVVKVVAPKLEHDPRFVEMLASEAKLAARLRHANVAQVEDLGREDGSLFIAMEYVEGLDLRELLRRAARERVAVPVEFSLLVITEALRALSYAHRMGVIHRDVSPSNVLVSFEGEVKLCDFGIARAADVASLPPEEALQGKFGYMSPEHARGEALDERADVFAAGILLWELCAGRRLYRSEGGEPLIEVARRAEIPPLPERRLPDEATLHAIVMRALEGRRDDRYPSAAAMLRDLTSYVASARLVASPLRFGEWVRENFGAEVLAARRARERAMRALDLGPPAVIEPIARPIPARAAPEDAVADAVAAPWVTAAPSSPGLLAHLRRLVAPWAVALAIATPAFWYLATR
jgi:serine/threonine-protein kinase